MRVLLETKRLLLRRFTANDAQFLFELDNDPEVMRYINGGTPTPLEIIEKEILPVFLNHEDQFPTYGFWAAIEKNSHGFLGWFVFRPVAAKSTREGRHEVDIGYRLHKRAWGVGYATEGARALIDKGFRESGVTCVTATTYEENQASRRVMEKLGMTFRRSFRITSEDIANTDTHHTSTTGVWDGNDVEYSLEITEWKKFRHYLTAE